MYLCRSLGVWVPNPKYGRLLVWTCFLRFSSFWHFVTGGVPPRRILSIFDVIFLRFFCIFASFSDKKNH